MQNKLFGFIFGRKPQVLDPAPVTPDPSETTLDIQSVPGFISPQYGSIYNDGASAATENDYINKYRELSGIPEVDLAIEEIVAETLIYDDEEEVISLNLDKLEVSPAIKQVIEEEFKYILSLLSFNTRGHDILKRWYIDGRINYYVLIDEERPRNGVTELRYIDPRKVKKVREIMKQNQADTSVAYVSDIKEYYLYNEQGVNNLQNTVGSIQISSDSIVHCNSGLYDPSTNIILGHLHKAIRVANNMRMMEDAMLIYKLSRAPERRIFYIDTGNLPKAKAEQYVQQIADKYRTKIVYDVNTGEIKNDKRYLAMTEDFWIPRREGSTGTQIDTLEGGSQTGETNEADYFKEKLYMSLNVPASRFDSQPSIFSSGTEITRDELRFSRFIARMRVKFNALFLELLQRQLVLKGIMTYGDFEQIRDRINFRYHEDNYFAEAMKSTILQGRLSVLAQVDPFVGKYISREWVYKNVFYMTEEERQFEEQQIIEVDIPFMQVIAPPEEQITEDVIPESTPIEEDIDDFVEEELAESKISLNNAMVEYLSRE